jgi:hypothetical protein
MCRKVLYIDAAQEQADQPTSSLSTTAIAIIIAITLTTTSPDILPGTFSGQPSMLMTTKKTTTNNHDYDEDWDRWFQELANPTNLVVVAADPVTGQLQEYRMTLPELEKLIEKETPDNRNELND